MNNSRCHEVLELLHTEPINNLQEAIRTFGLDGSDIDSILIIFIARLSDYIDDLDEQIADGRDQKADAIARLDALKLFCNSNRE